MWRSERNWDPTFSASKPTQVGRVTHKSRLQARLADVGHAGASSICPLSVTNGLMHRSRIMGCEVTVRAACVAKLLGKEFPAQDRDGLAADQDAIVLDSDADEPATG
jgi:hypothetical protein